MIAKKDFEELLDIVEILIKSTQRIESRLTFLENTVISLNQRVDQIDSRTAGLHKI